METAPPLRTIAYIFLAMGGLCLVLMPFGNTGILFLMSLPSLAIGGIVLAMSKSRDQQDVVVYKHLNCRIMGRYGFDALNQMGFDETYLDMDDPATKLYVRVEVPGSSSKELRVVQELWEQCGEGMWGNVTIQGHYMIAFERIADPTKR